MKTLASLKSITLASGLVMSMMSSATWGQIILSGSNRAVSDFSNDGNPAVTTQNHYGTVLKFDSAAGVLTGLSATATIDSGSWLKKSGDAGAVSLYVNWFLASLAGNSFVSLTMPFNGTNQINGTFTQPALNSIQLNGFVSAPNDTMVSSNFSASLYANLTQTGTRQVNASVVSQYSGSTLKDVSVSQTMTYTSIAHGNASFESNTSDVNTKTMHFGQIASNTNASQSFSIFDILGGLGIAKSSFAFLSGDNVFSITGGSSFIAENGSSNYTANFIGQNPLVQTSYSGVYRLSFTDNRSGLGNYASSSILTNFVDLTLVASVPEPGSYAMMFAGLATLGFITRRRRPQA